jgi:hypothetical protein
MILLRKTGICLVLGVRKFVRNAPKFVQYAPKFVPSPSMFVRFSDVFFDRMNGIYRQGISNFKFSIANRFELNLLHFFSFHHEMARSRFGGKATAFLIQPSKGLCKRACYIHLDVWLPG